MQSSVQTDDVLNSLRCLNGLILPKRNITTSPVQPLQQIGSLVLDPGSKGLWYSNGLAWVELATGTGVQFEPQNTLFVSPVWPAGSDPLVFFTTVAAALVQAAALGPTSTNSVQILIFPGTYLDDLVMVSNVCLTGTGNTICSIAGTITWTAGVGVNAPQAGDFENVTFVNLSVLGESVFDTTSKAVLSALPERALLREELRPRRAQASKTIPRPWPPPRTPPNGFPNALAFGYDTLFGNVTATFRSFYTSNNFDGLIMFDCTGSDLVSITQGSCYLFGATFFGNTTLAGDNSMQVDYQGWQYGGTITTSDISPDPGLVVSRSGTQTPPTLSRLRSGRGPPASPSWSPRPPTPSCSTTPSEGTPTISWSLRSEAPGASPRHTLGAQV